MRTLAILTIVFATAATTALAVKPGHPILGKWQITRPNGCTETYAYDANGNALVTSGAEVSESTFEISDAPGESGFYKYSETFVRNNGEPDCMGLQLVASDRFEAFIRFDSDQSSMLICFEESTAECFGPLTRVEPLRASLSPLRPAAAPAPPVSR